MSMLKLLRSGAGIIVNKELAKKMGLEVAVVYSELLDRFYFFKENDKLTEDGYFYCTANTLEEATTLSEYKQRKSINKLEKLGVIKTDLRDLPAKRYIKIIEDEEHIKELLKLNSSSEKIKELDVNNTSDPKKIKSSSEKIKELDVKKLKSNDTINNDTINNDKKSLYSTNIDGEAKTSPSLNNSKQNKLFNTKENDLEFKKKQLEEKINKKKLMNKKKGLSSNKGISPKDQDYLKLYKAILGEINWSDINYRAFAFYYLDKHNELMPLKIEYDKYIATSAIRDYLVNKYNISKVELMDYIDEILESYKRYPKRYPKNNEYFLSFNMIKTQKSMMNSLIERTKRNLELKEVNDEDDDEDDDVF